MLSLDLFDSKYEKKLHEGAVDSTIEHLLKPLSLRAAEIKTQIRSGKLSAQQIDKLEKEYEDLVQRRLDIILDRQPKNEQQIPVKPQPKGIGDIQDPKTKMAQLQQKAKKGPLANVGAGIKAFIKGEPEPLDEQNYGPIGSKALGNANFVLLQRAIKSRMPKFKFFEPPNEVELTIDEMMALGRAYNAYPSVYDKMDFIEYVLSTPEKLKKLVAKLKSDEPRPDFELTPPESKGLLEKKAEKKKFRDTQAQRELEIARATFPTAASDLEALTKLNLATDAEQDKSIQALSVSNKELQQQLAQLGAPATPAPTAAAPATPAMTAPAMPAVTPTATATAAPATTPAPVEIPAIEPMAVPGTAPKAKRATKTAGAKKAPAKKLGKKLSLPPGDVDRPRRLSAPDREAQRWSQSMGQLVTPEEVPQFIDLETEPVKESSQKVDSMKDVYYAATQDLKNLTDTQFIKTYGISKVGFQRQYRTLLKAAPQQDLPVKEQFAMPGTTIPRKSLIQGYTVFFNPETRTVSVTRGGDSEEAAIEQQRIGTVNLRTFRQAADRLIDRIESDLNEAKEIRTREDFVRERDRLLRMISQETNPANKQILKSAIRQLENRAENEGWITIQNRMVREESSTSSEEAESAILKRIMVAHTDLLKEYGPKKVMQAVEEVAYGVGDLPEIGSSDVSGWVEQVKQILGVPEDPYYDDADEFGMPGSEFFPDEKLDEKWSAKYKRSINCDNPKGFSQRAHCQGRKK